MGLIDQHIVQLEAALALLHSNHDHAAQDKAQRDFAEQLGVGLASRLQEAAFRPSDISRILAAVDSTLAGDDLLGRYTKALQVSSISAAETAVRDALEALQLSKDAITSSDRSSGQQDGPHNSSATDAQQQGLELCTQLSKQLQGHLAQYSETGKQLTAIGEQLGKASECLTGLNEQLQAPPASSQAETLSKACQDLDEVLMSLAELQLAHEGSTQYTHNTTKTLKALRGLQKHYAPAAQSGSPQASGGKLNHVIEAQQAWNLAAAALQQDTSSISAATANLSSIHNSLDTLLRNLELDTDNTIAAESVHMIDDSDAQLQQLNVQQQQQLAACANVREQLTHLFDLVRNSSSSGGSAASAETSTPPGAHAAAAAADGSLSSSSCSPSHAAAAHHLDPAGTARVAGAVLVSHSLGDLDPTWSLNSSSNNTSGGGHHVPPPAAAAAVSSGGSPHLRCSRLGLASKTASVHSEYEAAQAAAEAAAGLADATRAAGLAAAAVVVAQQPDSGVNGPLQWHQNALSLVEDGAQPSRTHAQQQNNQQPQEHQHQQQQRGLLSHALQQLRELQGSLAAAVAGGQPLAGDELLQMCERLQQLVQHAQQETVNHSAGFEAVQLAAGQIFGDLGLDYSTVGSQPVDTSSMHKWGNPVFGRESYTGTCDAEALTPDSSLRGAYSKLKRMSAAQIEGVFIASVAATDEEPAGQACGASPRGSQQQKQLQQQCGLAIAVHHGSADLDELTTPRTRSDMPNPPSRLECLAKPPSSRDMDAATAAAVAAEVDSSNPKQDSGGDAAACPLAAVRRVVADADTSAAVAVDELLAATKEVSNRLGPNGLADLVEAAAAVQGLGDVAILISLITHLVQHQQGVAALAAKLQQQQLSQGSDAPPTATEKLAVGTSTSSTPTSTTAAAATWTIPAVYDDQQRKGQTGTFSTGDSMAATPGRAKCDSEEQVDSPAAAAQDSSSHASRQLTRSSTLGLPTTLEGSAGALADEDSSLLLHTSSDVCCATAESALEGQSGAVAAIQRQQRVATDVASPPLGQSSCWGNNSSGITAEGEQSGEAQPTCCCSDSSILAGPAGKSLRRSDSYLSSLNKMLLAESRQMQQQVELLQQQHAKAQAEAASLREKLQQEQQQQQSANQQQQVAELLEQLAAAEAAAAVESQHAAELEQRLSAAAVEADGMQRQQEQHGEELQAQLVQLQLIEQLQQHFAEAQQEIASLTKQQHDRQQEVEDLLLQHQQQLQGLQQQLVQANEQVAFFTEQQASLSALQHENQHLQQQYLVLQQQLTAAKPESEQLQRASAEPDPAAAGSSEVKELPAPVKCSSPVKKGRLPLFRRATTDAVTASCPTFALGPATGDAASPSGSPKFVAKRAVQGNNDTSSSLHESLEGTSIQHLPPSSGSPNGSAPKRRVTWDINPSSAAAAAAAASAQKALRAFLGAIKGAGSGKKHLVGRVMVDGTVSIQPEDSAAASSPVGRSEQNTSGNPAPVVGLVEFEDGPEKQQHLQQQRWRQQQLQVQRSLAEQPAGTSDAEEWDVQHSAFSLTYQHRSVSEIGVQPEELDHPAAAAAAAEASVPAGDNTSRTDATGASVPAKTGPVGAGPSGSGNRVAGHMPEQKSHLEAQGGASVQQLLEDAASFGPGLQTQQQQQQAVEGSAVSTVQYVEKLGRDLRARQLEIEDLQHEVSSKAAQLTTLQQELQRRAERELQLTTRLEAAESIVIATQSQLASLTSTVAAAETAAKAAAVAESAMAVNVLAQANELQGAQEQLKKQSEKVQRLLLKLEHAETTVAAAYGLLAAICGTVTAAEGAARAAAAAAVTADAAGELSQQVRDLRVAQQQLQQQSIRMQELMAPLESAGGAAAAATARLEAVQESVAVAGTRVVVPAEQYWQQADAAGGAPVASEDDSSSQQQGAIAAAQYWQQPQQQQAAAAAGVILPSEDDNSSQQHGLSEWSANMEVAAVSQPHVALELAADSGSSEGAGSSNSVPFTQLQAALALARRELMHKEQQLCDLQDWVELLRLGLARVRQALDSNQGHTECKHIPPLHSPSPQCKELAAVGSSSTASSSTEVCCLAAAAAHEAATESTPGAAAATVVTWSEATAEQLVLLHEVQSIADEVRVVCCERHLLQNALQEQLRAISRLERSLQAAKQQQGLQEDALLQLEEEQIAAANAAAEQRAAAQRAIEQQEQEQMTTAAAAVEQLSIIQKAMLKHEEAQQTATNEKIGQLQQQEQVHCAAVEEAQQALALLTQQQQEQQQQWLLREQEYQAAAAAATQKLLESQQQQHDQKAAAAEAMQKLADLVDQQQHKEAEWQQQEQQHLAAAKAAAERIAALQQQEQDQRIAAAEALQHLAALVEQQAASEQDWQQRQQPQQAIAAEAAQQLADMQEQQAAAAAVAEQLTAALDQQQEQQQAAIEAAARIVDLQSQLEVAGQEQQTAAPAQVAELQAQLQSAQQAGQCLEGQVDELQAHLGIAQEAAQQQQTAAAAAAAQIAELQAQLQLVEQAELEQCQVHASIAELQSQSQSELTQQALHEQQAVAAEVADLRGQLQSTQEALHEQQAAAAESAAELAGLQHQLQLVQQAAEEQHAAAAESESTITDLQSRLHAAQMAEQQQQIAAAEAAETISKLQDELQLVHAVVQEQQIAAAAAEATIADLRHQIQKAQTAAEIQQAAAADSARQLAEQLAQQQQAAVEAASIITDLRRQLQAAEQQQVTTAAEVAAMIGQLESRLELACAAEQEQQAAAAQASAAIASLQDQLQAAQATAQEVAGFKERISTLHAKLEAAEAQTKDERTAAAEAAASLAELQLQLLAAQAAKHEQQAVAADSAAQVTDLQGQLQAAFAATQQVPLLKQEISTLHAQLEAAYAETEEVAGKAFAALQQGSTAAAAADASKASAEEAAAAVVAAEAAAQQARHELAQLQQQHTELSRQKGELASEVAAAQQQKQNAEQQVSDLQQQVQELTSLHDVLMQQLQRVDQSTAGPLATANSPRGAAVAAGFDFQSSSKAVTSKVDQLRCITEQVQQLWSAHSRAQELTDQLAAAEQALQQQKKTAFAAHARAADLQHRLAVAELSSESLAATQQAEQARQQQAAAAEVQGLRQQVTDLRSELAAADQARQKQEHAATAAAAGAQGLRQQISALTAEIQQLQSECEQLRQQQDQAAAAAAVEAKDLKQQLAALQSECDGIRQQMQAMLESCADRDREIEEQQHQLAHLQAELADLTHLNQHLAAAAAAAATGSSQVATTDAMVQTDDTTNSTGSIAGRVDQQILSSWGSMTLRNSLRGSREGGLRISRDGGLRTSRDGAEQQQQDAFTLMRDLTARERELADLKALLQGREATLADTTQELMLVQQSMSELQDQLAELQAELHMVRTEAAVKVAAANNNAFASKQAARQSQEVASAAALHSSKADSSMVQQLQHQLKVLQGQLAAEQEGRLRGAAAFATALKQAGADTANVQAVASEEIMQLQGELGQNMRLVQQQADQLQQQADQLQQHEEQQQQHEEQLQSSRDQIQKLQQQLAERVKQLQQQQGLQKQLRQTVAQLQQQLHMLQDQILGRQQLQQVAAGKRRSADFGGMDCAEFADHHAEGPLTQALSRGASPTGELLLHKPQLQGVAVLPDVVQESQQLRLQLAVKQHTISKLQKQLAEVTSGQTASLSIPSPAAPQITQISSPSPPNLGQAASLDRTRCRSDRTRSGSQTADSAVVASLRQHAAMLEGVLLDVQAESAAKDDVMQELTQQAELRVGAGYARTEELRRLYRDMASKDAYISRLEARVRAITTRTPSPTQPEQQQRPTAHKPQQQQPQRSAAEDRGQAAALPAEPNALPKRSYVQLQAQLQAAMNSQQHQQSIATDRTSSTSSAAAAAATLKQRAAARLQGNDQAASVAPEPSSEGGAHPTQGRYADSTEAMDAAAGVAGQGRSAHSSNSNNGSLPARQRLATVASVESIISGQAAGVASVGAASTMSKVSPRLQQQGSSHSSSGEAGVRRSLTGSSWQQRQQPGVVGTSSSSNTAKPKSAGNFSASNLRGDPMSNTVSPQITTLRPNPVGAPIYTLNSHSNTQMWVSNTLYSPRTTAESARSQRSDNSSSGGRGGDGGGAVMRAAMQQLQQLRLQRQNQQLEGVRRSIQGYPLQQPHSAEWE